MVRQAVRQLLYREVGHNMAAEIEPPALPVRQGQIGLLLHGLEPGDLIEEAVEFGSTGRGEDRPIEAFMVRCWREAGRDEGLVERVILPIDVEVAEADEIVAVIVLLLRPIASPL